MTMSPISEHDERVLDQEIDAVKICPTCPDYLIVATYSLVSAPQGSVGEDGDVDKTDRENSNSQTRASRIGSLQILPVCPDGSTTSQQQQQQQQQHNVVARCDLACAVLDIHFDPSDGTQLCASTSIGELRFFRISSLSPQTISGTQSARIEPLGIAHLSPHTPDGVEFVPPLITQFAWLKSTPHFSSSSGVIYELVACDTNGQVKLVQVEVPFSTSGNDSPNNGNVPEFRCAIHLVHEHLYSLEAWTVAAITLSLEEEPSHELILSGGDDSCLIVSACKLGLQKPRQDENELAETSVIAFESVPKRVHLDKHTHTAGVVSILPFRSISVSGPDMTAPPASLVLTGSYDQSIRLWLLDSATYKLKLISDFELEGGVWRIALLDTYLTHNGDCRSTNNYILLVSAMHAGCYVIRMTETFDADSNTSSWRWSVEARFTEPHQSMVYACAARQLRRKDSGNTGWKIITTSFYDKRICGWEWIDHALREIP